MPGVGDAVTEAAENEAVWEITVTSFHVIASKTKKQSKNPRYTKIRGVLIFVK